MESAQSRLEELQLVQCSLLPGERMEFVEDADYWNGILSGSMEVDVDDPDTQKRASMTAFTLKVDDQPIWLQITMHMRSDGNVISVKGENLGRKEQERWQKVIKEKEAELEGDEFPLYNILTQLIPILHNSTLEEDRASIENEALEGCHPPDDAIFHVLFTSHHLISTKKRKSLQQWTTSLKLSGFAKVGYPGVIYAQGTQGNLEDFVANVKAMQWLALKVRFLELVPDKLLANAGSLSGWQEFSRVGEVVEEMKRWKLRLRPASARLPSSIGASSISPRLRNPLGPLTSMCRDNTASICYLLTGTMSSKLGFRLSRSVLTTASPPIPKAYGWAERYNATPSKPLIDMSQGVPGIPPPKELRRAIGEASVSPENFSYCRWDGESSLRLALSEEMKTVYGTQADIRPEDIALTAGCNMAFMAAIMTLADAEDEVILPYPWYFNHEMDLSLLGVKAVGLPTLPEDGYLPSVSRCEALITPKTKAIVLVTPNNPTGAIYPPSLIASFTDLAVKHQLPLIIDETYRDFVTTEAPPHALFTRVEPWRPNFIHLFSFSKSYCLPGYRLGAIAASPEFLVSVKTVLDCLQICPPRPVQLGLAPLLPSLRSFVRENALAVNSRHALFKALLPVGWTIGAQGGYFAFVRHPYSKVGAERLARTLAEKEGLLTLPATFFMPPPEGAHDGDQHGSTDGDVAEDERWLRFSVANVSDDKIRDACGRLATFRPS